MSPFYTASDHFVLKPAILLALFGCAILIFDFLLFPKANQKRWLIAFVILGLGFTSHALWQQYQLAPTDPSLLHAPWLTAFGGAMLIDGFSLYFNAIFTLATLIVSLASYRYLEEEDIHHGEYYALLLFAQCGMYFLVTAADLVTLFVGLELMALCFYVLVGFQRSSKRCNEAAIKYLLLGAFSSGLLAYGFSLLFGIAGSTLLANIAVSLSEVSIYDPLVLMAITTISAGLLFKISAAPFHMWAPDAYEGAPTPITAYLSVASKAASFAFLLRLLLGPLSSLRSLWEPVLIAAALASLTIGNFAALSQNNIKRLLAYSSISHAGYMLLGLVAGNATGYQGVLVYLLVYSFMNLGAFLVLLLLRRGALPGEEIDDLTGLMKRNPAAALLMLLFLLSLAGLPPTAGFIGKYYILLSLVESEHYFLAMIAAVYVAVAVYYYFRMVMSMFSNEEPTGPPVAQSAGLRFSLAATGIVTLGIGLYPAPVTRLAPSPTMPMVTPTAAVRQGEP